MDDITVGELVRRLERIERKIDAQHSVSPEVFGLHAQGVERRLEELEDGAKWLTRALVLAWVGIIGTVITSAVTGGLSG